MQFIFSLSWHTCHQSAHFLSNLSTLALHHIVASTSVVVRISRPIKEVNSLCQAIDCILTLFSCVQGSSHSCLPTCLPASHLQASKLTPASYMSPHPMLTATHLHFPSPSCCRQIPFPVINSKNSNSPTINLLLTKTTLSLSCIRVPHEFITQTNYLNPLNHSQSL